MVKNGLLRKVEGRHITIGGGVFVLTRQRNLYTKTKGGYTFSTPQEINLVKEVLRREIEARRQQRQIAEAAGLVLKKKKKLVKGGQSRGWGSMIEMDHKPMPVLGTGHARKYPGGANVIYGFKVQGGGFVPINGIGTKRKITMPK